MSQHTAIADLPLHDRFESVYADAGRDASRVPWADERPHPALVAWLNAEAPGLIRPGARVAVVGCGIGDDAAELHERGYDVLGFDVSESAITWARERHCGPRFEVADLLALPSNLVRRFDLVVEVNTLQALEPDLLDLASEAISSLAKPHGTIVAICRGCDDDQVEVRRDPPHPLSPERLQALFAAHGFFPIRQPDDFLDDETPPVRRLRACFQRD
ncbi:MAG: class I SAM-dependent methyltransferase [Phycisphaerales bacterium]|nr:class I SAM-dependent methyltransferase [Phycisphaerales bacterium]